MVAQRGASNWRLVVGLIPVVALIRNNPGQVVHTLLPLSPSSIIWYRYKNREVNGRLWKRYIEVQ